MRSKKAQALAQLAGLGVGIATLVIVLTVTFLVLAEGQQEALSIAGQSETMSQSMGCNNGTFAVNATCTMQDATADIPGWVPLIVIAVVGAILLGLVSLFRR